MSPWKPTEWTISTKTVKDLSDHPFDGNITHYKEWHDMMRDHLLSANQGFGRVIYEVEKTTFPLTMDILQSNQYAVVGLNCDLLWVTRQLWTFMSRIGSKAFSQIDPQSSCK